MIRYLFLVFIPSTRGGPAAWRLETATSCHIVDTPLLVTPFDNLPSWVSSFCDTEQMRKVRY